MLIQCFRDPLGDRVVELPSHIRRRLAPLLGPWRWPWPAHSPTPRPPGTAVGSTAVTPATGCLRSARSAPLPSSRARRRAPPSVLPDPRSVSRAPPALRHRGSVSGPLSSSLGSRPPTPGGGRPKFPQFPMARVQPDASRARAGHAKRDQHHRHARTACHLSPSSIIARSSAYGTYPALSSQESSPVRAHARPVGGGRSRVPWREVEMGPEPAPCFLP